MKSKNSFRALPSAPLINFLLYSTSHISSASMTVLWQHQLRDRSVYQWLPASIFLRFRKPLIEIMFHLDDDDKFLTRSASSIFCAPGSVFSSRHSGWVSASLYEDSLFCLWTLFFTRDSVNSTRFASCRT